MTDNRNNYLIFENRNRLYQDEVLQTKPEPHAGTRYTVPKGAFLDTISFRVYGYDRTADIIEVNQQLLKDRNIIAGLPNIYPRDILWLPPLETTIKPIPETIDAETDTEVAIRINGVIYHGWTANSITRSINNIADGFSFTAPYSPDDPDSINLDPFTYFPCELYIGGELYIAGVCEKWNPSFSADKTTMSIACRSRAGVLVDCPSQLKNLSFTKQTLEQITAIMLKPFGLTAEFPDDYNNGIINKTKRSVGEKIASYIQKLSKSAGYILNSTTDGNVKFERANVDGIPILNLKQGEQPLIGVSADYDGTQRFSDYEAMSQSTGKPGNRSIIQDESIPVFRPSIFEAKDTTAGNIKDSAKWEKSRALSRSFKVSVVVATWRDKNNDLIFENNIITLYAPNVSIFQETKFLIEKVTPTESDSGQTATLELVLPESYTLSFPSIFPWSRK